MGKRHAFLILANGNLETLLILLQILHQSAEADVFLHLDAEKHQELKNKIPANLVTAFIDDPVNIHWGGFSMLEAQDKLIAKALELSQAKYFTLLSDSCFPLRSLESFYRFVEESDKEFIYALNAFEVGEGIKKKHLLGWSLLDWPLFNPKTYKNILLSKVVWKLSWIFVHIPRISLSELTQSGLKPYFGSQWWTLSRSALQYLQENPAPAFRKILRYSFAPDEYYVQTLIMNSPLRDRVYRIDELEKLMADARNNFTNTPHGDFNLRYSDWGNHNKEIPKHLNLSDLNAINNSQAYFARKIIDGTSQELRDELLKRQNTNAHHRQ